MPGWITNGAPLVGPASVNGAVLPLPNGQYPQLDSHALVSADTELAAGGTPQTVGAAAAQIAMIAAAMIHNTQTSTVHAATINTFSGQVITEALSTASGATYTFTLTNSLITATSTPLFDIRSGTNTTPGMVPTSVTCSAGSAVLVFTNTGTAALNGTMVIAFHL